MNANALTGTGAGRDHRARLTVDGAGREHDENGLDCWCEPEIAYEDDETRVIVHHHWVNGEARDE